VRLTDADLGHIEDAVRDGITVSPTVVGELVAEVRLARAVASAPILPPLPVEMAGHRRDPRWEAAAHAYLIAHPVCEFCGLEPATEVHHIVPFHTPKGKSLELVPSNWMALSRACHFAFGHFHDWSDWNPEVRELAATFARQRDAYLGMDK
jgi:hypothetical protein